jgi:hypothetical protein
LADAIGVDKSVISNWLHEHQFPTGEQILAVQEWKTARPQARYLSSVFQLPELGRLCLPKADSGAALLLDIGMDGELHPMQRIQHGIFV